MAVSGRQTMYGGGFGGNGAPMGMQGEVYYEAAGWMLYLKKGVQ